MYSRKRHGPASNIIIRSLLLCCIVAPVFIQGCAKKKEKPKERPPVPVAVTPVLQKSVPVMLKGIGNVEAYNSVPIKTQVNGMIARVHFREGQDVRKGDLLFTIDPRPFQVALKQAEAVLAKDLALAKNAEEQSRRYSGLLQDGIVTREQHDQLKASAESFSAIVAADRAVVENARIQLSFCYVRAPLSGRTGSLMVNEGALVKANDTTPLVTINQISPIYVTFTLPEKQLSGLKNGMAGGKVHLEASIPNDPGMGEKGVICFLDNAVDMATGTIRLKGTFANERKRLWPGQFVNVAVSLGERPNSVVAPAAAVQTGQKGQYVFVVGTDGLVELRNVSAEVVDGTAVVGSGLRPGEVVVTDGVMNLAPGTKVLIKSGEPGTSSPAPKQEVPKLKSAAATPARQPL